MNVIRHVRTPEGREKYGEDIGEIIHPDLPDLTPDQDHHLDALRDHPVNRLLGQKFADAGRPLFLVGGSVRDAMAGHPDFADLDYTTDATPEQIHAIVDSLGPTWGIGEEFGTVGIQIQGLKTEITTFRAERYDEASRKPVVVFGTNIGDDLARRDLTMNAMALTMSSDGTHPVGSLVDPYGGAKDLAAGILRTPDDPHKSMSEDPLRQLRVVRFAAKRDAKPDPALRQAVIDLHDRLSIVSPERKTAELRKILDGGPEVTARAMQLAGELGVADDLFGGLFGNHDLDPHGFRGRFAITDMANLPPDSDPITLLAFLASLVNRPALDGDEAARRMAAMRLSNEEIRPAIDAARLVRRMSDPGGAIDARQLVRSTDDATLRRARIIAFTTRIDGPMRRRVESILADPALIASLRGPLPLDGNDLVAAGLSGPAVGAALRKVTDAFLANPQLTRAQALAVAGVPETDHRFVSDAAAITASEADPDHLERMREAYMGGLPVQEGTQSKLLRDDANRAAAKAEVARKIFDRLDDAAKHQLAEDVARDALRRIRDMVPGYIEVAELDPADGDRLLASLTNPFDPRLVWVKKEYDPSDTSASGWDWAAPWHDNIERLLGRQYEQRYPDVPPEGLTWVGENGRDEGRTFYFKRGDDPALRDELALSAVSDFIHSWASTSNDSNERALAIQDAINLEFGLDHAMGWVNTFDPSPDQLEGYQRQVARQQALTPLYRQLIRAMYDNTQEWLAANGITEVLAYRGMTWLHKDEGLPPDWFDAAENDTLIPTPPLRPASSWAYGHELAEAFAAFSGSVNDARPRSSALLTAVVPATAILATPRSGFGCLPEEELVILSFGGEVRVELRRPQAPQAETKAVTTTGRAYAGNLTYKDGTPSPADPDSAWATCPVCASTGHLPRTGVCLSCKGRGGAWETKSFLHRVRTPAGREQFGQDIGEIIRPDVIPDVVPRVRIARPLPPIRDFSAWGDRGHDIEQLARVIDRSALLSQSEGHDVPLTTQKALTEIFHYHDRQTGLTQDPFQFVNLGPGRWRVVGNIVDRDGNDAGTFEKTIDLGQEPPGAFHGLIQLWDKYQGQGFGERLLRHEENAYVAAGVDHVDLLAGLNVGGYAWARAGFDWHFSPGAMRAPWFRVRRRMEEMLEGDTDDAEKELLRDMLARLRRAEAGPWSEAVSVAPTPHEIAMLGYASGQTLTERRAPSQRHLGKRILQGSEWEARKTLVPPLVLAGKAMTNAQLARARALAAAAEDWWKECQARGFDLGDDGLDWAPGTTLAPEAKAARRVRTSEGVRKYDRPIGSPITGVGFTLPSVEEVIEKLGTVDPTEQPLPNQGDNKFWLSPDGRWVPTKMHGVVAPYPGYDPGLFPGAMVNTRQHGRPIQLFAERSGMVRVLHSRSALTVDLNRPLTNAQLEALLAVPAPKLVVDARVPEGVQWRGFQVSEGWARPVEHFETSDPDQFASTLTLANRVARGQPITQSRLAEFKTADPNFDPDLETKKKPKKVKTPKGVEKYHAPIGTPIVAHPDLPATSPARFPLGSRGNPWQVSSAKQAVEHLAAGDYVQLSRPKHAVTLIKELRKVAKQAEERGEQAPIFDLCKVTVEDTSLFCVRSKGVARIKMPQLTGIPIPGSRADNLLRDAKGKVDLGPFFLEHLAKHGAIVHHDIELASRLFASQNELDGAKVGRMMRRIRKGAQVRELFVSDDNYIVDGHHHWAATVGLSVEGSQSLYMRVARVDMGILELLDLANDFTREWGIAARAVDTKAATAVDHVRTPEGARRYDLPIGAPIVSHPSVSGLPDIPVPALPVPALPSPDLLDNDVNEMTEKARYGQLDNLGEALVGNRASSHLRSILDLETLRQKAKRQIAEDITTRLDLDAHSDWRAQVWGQRAYGNGVAITPESMSSNGVWRRRTDGPIGHEPQSWEYVGTKDGMLEQALDPSNAAWGNLATPHPGALDSGDVHEGYEYRWGDDPALRHDMDVWGTSNLINGWARTSNDHDPDALVMQEAAAAEFGIPDDQQAPWDLVEAQYIGGVVSPRRVDKYSSTVASEGSFDTYEEAAAASEAAMVPYREQHLPLYRAFVRAQYDATQQWYKDRGITHVEVFRGMKWEYDTGEPEPPAWYRAAQAQILASHADAPETRRITRGMARTDQIILRPASAWSYARETSMAFAGQGSSAKDWALLRTVIPVERILSNARTGFGCLPEEEVVVIGGAGEYEVVVNMADDKGYGILVGRDAAKALADQHRFAEGGPS